MFDFLVVIPDILGVSVMGGVTIWGLPSFAYLVKEHETSNLRYIWVPNIISFSFFFALLMIMFLNDAFGTIRTPFYIILHVLVLVGSGFFGLGMFRFIKTIRSHIESKKKAQASLVEIQKEIVNRLEKQDAADPSQKSKDMPAKK